MTDMSGWTLIEFDVETGRSLWFRTDGEREYWKETYDVSPIIEANKMDYNESQPGWRGDWHRVASVPIDLIFGNPEFDGIAQAIREGDDKWLRRFLNDPDHRAFRTKEGRL